jgi:creatinine amidohydrolase/Fe(II)-dependent formamide hydrolase-like protein
MFLKREVVEVLNQAGISKFILVGENVLNFHGSDDSYYEEWFQDVEDEEGWIVALNFQEHVLEEFRKENLDYYLIFGGELDTFNWRKFNPIQLYSEVQKVINYRLGA